MQLVPEGHYGPPPQSGEGVGQRGLTIAPPAVFGIPERPISAIRRYKWVIFAVVVLSTAGGTVAVKYVKPEYESSAKIWVESQTPQENGGPIRQRELLNPTAWVELFKTFKVFDAVVRKLGLYVKPLKDSDANLLAGLTVSDRFYVGSYNFRVDKRTKRWHLSMEDNPQADSGSVGDSIGRPMGLNGGRWTPKLTSASAGLIRDVKPGVEKPRETSQELLTRFSAFMPVKSNFMVVTLTDKDPRVVSRVLNALTDEYVAEAADLKKNNLSQFSQILSRQLDFAETSLRESEAALENFKVQTITLPQENSPVAPGVEETRLTAMNSPFFGRKIEYDNLKNDRIALEKAIAESVGGEPSEAMLMNASVMKGAGGNELRDEFAQLLAKEKDLRDKQQIYTDSFPAVRDLKRDIEQLRSKDHPHVSQRPAGPLEWTKRTT